MVIFCWSSRIFTAGYLGIKYNVAELNDRNGGYILDNNTQPPVTPPVKKKKMTTGHKIIAGVLTILVILLITMASGFTSIFNQR